MKLQRGSDDFRTVVELALCGVLDRRAALQRLAAMGLPVPAAGALVSLAGAALASGGDAYRGGRRGGGGVLKARFWQGAAHLNPHLTSGSKEQEAARVFYEPLASWDNEGELIPILAAEIPSRGNGGLAADGRSVVWRLKRGVSWHDGQAFSADDCVFTWEYARDPATTAVTIENYKDTRVEKLDEHAIRVTFPKPTPNWATAFVGPAGAVLPRHVFAAHAGGRARSAPANLSPVGTGPYRFGEFKPGEWLRATLNARYHMADRPFFDAIEISGGGDALSAARAVLQSGEADYAWNLQVEDEILRRLESGGQGRTHLRFAGNVEFIQLNHTDPWNEVDGERASARSRHFAFADAKVREAMALLVDRRVIQQQVWGRTGDATANFLNAPARFRSANTRIVFDPARASALLDEAGWRRDASGVRSKGPRRLRLVFQTSVNQPRQKSQTLMKETFAAAGVELELKSVPAATFFGGDVASPDTYTKFWADMQMYTTTMQVPDPAVFMGQFVSWEIASKENRWQGRNVTRFNNAEFDQLYRSAESELDPLRRAELFVRMNGLVMRENVVIPLVWRPRITGLSMQLDAPLSAWDLDFSTLHNWSRPGNGVAVVAPPPVIAVAPAAPPPAPALAPTPSPARSPYGRRVALVIGNGRYTDNPLRNPTHDAEDVAAALKRFGFAVQHHFDQSRSQTLQAVRRFAEAAVGAEAALFYFAGHGVQVRGRNYLLPVGQRFVDEADVEADAIDVGAVLRWIEEGAPRVVLLILDACRSPVIVRSSRAAVRGLARMDAPSGALVAFAAQPGTEAQDGDARNGVYTAALLRHLPTSGITVEQLFKRVRADVERVTGGRQSPREESSLKGDDFYFVGP